MTPTELVLSKLPDARRNGQGWIAKCRAHDDRTPSLSIDIADNGGCLVKCFAGCSQEAAVSAIGLTLGDLMPNNGNPLALRQPSPRKSAKGKTPRKPSEAFLSAREAAAVYEKKLGPLTQFWTYDDANGDPCGLVLRWNNPDGSKRDVRPVSRWPDGWRREAMPTPRPLYRLPELRDAAPQTPIYVCEGEKCVDAAASLGLLATTSAGGNSAAKQSDWTPLSGRNVNILPDNDKPGQDYADAVAAILAKLNPPATVKVVPLPGLPPGGDVFDYIEAGRQEGKTPESIRAELERLANAANTIEADSAKQESGAPIVLSMADIRPEAVTWLWPGRIALGKLTLVAGDPGLGKSFLTLDVASRVSTGGAWPDRRGEVSEAGGVVLLSAEDDPGDTIRPRLDAAGADVGRIALLKAVRTFDPERGGGEAFFCLGTDLRALEAAIAQTANCRLVVIDPVTAYLGKIDSHVNAEVRSVFGPLADLAARCRVAILAVTHLRKGDGLAIYRAMGSLAFVAAARAVWAVGKDQADPTGRRRLFLPIKNNISADGTGLAFTLTSADNGTAVVAWESEPVTTTADNCLAPPERRRGPEPEAQEAAAAWLRSILAGGVVPVDNIQQEARAAGYSWATVRRAKDVLRVVVGKAGFSGGWTWRLRGDGEGAQEPERLPSSTNNLSAFGKPERLRVFDPESGDETLPAEPSFTEGAEGAQVSGTKRLRADETPPLSDDDAGAAADNGGVL